MNTSPSKKLSANARAGAAIRSGKIARQPCARCGSDRAVAHHGRPVTTGRGEARVQVRLSAAERGSLAAVAGGTEAIPAYLRGAGLALPLIVAALESGGDTLTGEEACGIALGVLRRVVPRRDEPTERPPRARKE